MASSRPAAVENVPETGLRRASGALFGPPHLREDSHQALYRARRLCTISGHQSEWDSRSRTGNSAIAWATCAVKAEPSRSTPDKLESRRLAATDSKSLRAVSAPGGGPPGPPPASAPRGAPPPTPPPCRRGGAPPRNPPPCWVSWRPGLLAWRPGRIGGRLRPALA